MEIIGYNIPLSRS